MDKKAAQAMLLAHYKSPTGLGEFHEQHTISKGTNALCGDEISVGVILDNNTITDITFQARACSICIASSSIMSQLLINKETTDIEPYYQQLTTLLKNPSQEGAIENGKENATENTENDIDERLKPLGSIHTMPSRHKCAQISWEALRAACANTCSDQT